jgi:endonuclease-3
MQDKFLPVVISRVKREVSSWGGFHRRRLKSKTADPFKTLVSCIISLRTRDEVTAEASSRLFHIASTPRAMGRLKVKEIQDAVYPAGFYRNKARQISELSKRIAGSYGGKTPDTIEELLKFKGVGRKTANLVVSRGFGNPAVCVDTHVHRIMNRLGYVKTEGPEATEMALRKKLPKRYWIGINPLLVSFGQVTCTPVSPWCSMCVVRDYCDREGVKKFR